MQAISVFDIFKVGVGPSSSHTMGPWRAAQRFTAYCTEHAGLDSVERIRVHLYDSLAKTGIGHGTDVALILGLSGEDPVTCDISGISDRIERVKDAGELQLAGAHRIVFNPSDDIAFHPSVRLDYHPNGLRFEAQIGNSTLLEQTYFSVGGGFIVQEGIGDEFQSAPLPHPIETAEDLTRHCEEHGLSIPDVVRINERIWRDDAAIDRDLLHIWTTMKECAFRGCYTDGTLPGGLNVIRRAANLNRTLLDGKQYADPDAWIAAIRMQGDRFRNVLTWVSCFALAVNEENAAFGRVVTAPTNGAAGVIPAVLLYLVCTCDAEDADVIRFLLIAGELGSIFKKGATLSAAMGGCQAEIGVSSAMAAGALAHCLGGSNAQVLMAAEIAMEHHLGLTCDPAGGLVQIPCIERNTMGAIKAISAANIAVASDPTSARVTLDAVVRTMWQTALDMNTKYKETSEGGLALQIPVSLAEC